MRLFPSDWLGFLDDLTSWGGLSIPARRTFLDGITPGLTIDAGRGDPALSELRDEGLLEEGARSGALAVAERFAGFHLVMKSLQKSPVFETPGLAVLCSYLGEHYTPQERSQLHESLALLPNDLPRIAGFVSSVEWLQAALERPRRGPEPSEAATARAMLAFFTEQRDRIPARDLEEYFPGLPREELGVALRYGILRVVFYLGLRRSDLEPLVGIWPSAARRLRRLSVVLAPVPVEAVKRFHHPFLVEDMTTLLCAAFREPIPLRRGDDRPFARFVEDASAMLLTLPDWVESMTGLALEARVDLALQALRLAGLLQSSRLLPAASARQWATRPLAERRGMVEEVLRPQLFTLMDDDLAPVDGGPSEVAPWVTQAFASVPVSSFIRFADFAEYQSALGTPLAVSPALGAGAAGSGDGTGLATEEAVEELWKSFLGVFLGRCLLALGGAQAGLGADGRPLFRMTPAGRLLLGLPREGREEEPVTGEEDGVLIVSPNYEVVFLAPSPAREAELGRFCERVGREVGVLFRITRQSVQRAAAAGIGARHVLDALARGSRSALPANVDHEIRSWMEGGAIA